MHLHRRYLTLALISVTVVSSLFATTSATAQERKDTLPICTWKLPPALTFCGEGVPLDDPEVRERAEREFYINLQTPGQIMLYIKRSARYFPMYRRVMREMGMPEDLCYLSVAESALFMARSSKDAVGLWQFIPSTGRAMGLRIDEYVDERRHPEKSTRAAMKYLKLGYDSIGSWTGAAAGYNMGHTRYAENTTYQGTTNFYELYLNEETSRYILRIAIVKHLMTNAESFGIIVPEQDRYTATATRVVTVTTEIKNLAAWAADQGTTYMDVKILNPWILARTLPAPEAGRPWQIEIPAK